MSIVEGCCCDSGLIDAVVLVFLLKAVNDDDIGFGTAALLALFTSILAFGLALGLGSVLGLWGIVLAAVIVAGALGVAAAFMVIHIGIGLGLNYLMS